MLTPDGKVVAGLYAAGRTTSGIAKQGYSSGMSLGDASFFGRAAGRHAAAWLAASARGGPLPSGTYLLRLEAAGRTETVRGLLLE